MQGCIYLIGCDLGETTDYTAISLTERATVYRDDKDTFIHEYRVRYLKRFRGESTYPIIVQHLVKMFLKPEISLDGYLLVDQTGVGRAVIEMMRAEKLNPIGITITGGTQVTETPDGFNVPKKDLVSALLVLFQTGQIRIAAELPDADVLKGELENFRVKVNPRTGHESFEAWKDSDHDDMVISLAMPIWYASEYMPTLDTPATKSEQEEEEHDYLRSGLQE